MHHLGVLLPNHRACDVVPLFRVLHFPPFSSPAIWSVIFQVLHFPALRFGPSFSRSCIFQVLHFQSPPQIRRVSVTLCALQIYLLTYLLTYSYDRDKNMYGVGMPLSGHYLFREVLRSIMFVRWSVGLLVWL